MSEIEQKRMGFFDHLEELRARLMRCLWVFFAGFLGCYAISDVFLGFLRKPLFEQLPEGAQKLYFTNLFENFLIHLKISGYASAFVFSPYFFWEVWKFISPGLYERERKLAIPFILTATVFFIGGALFAYYVLFPVGFKYFVTYGNPVAEVPLLTMDAYYSTALKLMFLFGVAFEMPVLISLLGILGVVQSETLAAHRRTAILAITVVSALFAPPDAISMLILMAPLILMYEGSIHVVRIFGKRPEQGVADVEENPLHGGSK